MKEKPDLVSHTSAEKEQQTGQNELDQLAADLRRRRAFLFRGLAFVLVLSFLLLSFSGTLRLLGMPSLEFLLESARLSRDPDIAGYKQSVVAIAADEQRGTGFLTEEGIWIVTNWHVVAQSSQVQVYPVSGRRFLARVGPLKPEVDLALLEAGSLDLPGLVLETEVLPDLNEVVYMIGNPLGFFNIVNQATYTGQAWLAGWQQPVLTIRGPVYQGNSGSPVINQSGAVIGVLFATSSERHSDDGEQIGYVIPAAEVAALIQDAPSRSGR